MDRQARDAEELRDRIEELTRRGLAPREIACKLGCTTRTVSRARRARGCLVAAPRKPFTDDEVAQVESMLADGCSLNEIARTLGRSRSSLVRRWQGRGWTREQTNEYLSLERRSRELLRG